MLGNVTGLCIPASIQLKDLRKHLLSSSRNPPKLSKGGSFLWLSWVKQMNGMGLKSIQSIKFLLKVNFYISVIVLIAGGMLSVSGSYSIFEFNEELYGALDNNLRMIMVYLAMTESVILGYCFFRNNFQVMIPVGFFLILMIGSIEFYGEINSIEIDENFPLFFLYTGLSHILFGMMVGIERNNSNLHNEKTGKLSK
jgi:hypothetical protein